MEAFSINFTLVNHSTATMQKITDNENVLDKFCLAASRDRPLKNAKREEDPRFPLLYIHFLKLRFYNLGDE